MQFIAGLLNIMVINLLLSGDNAVVIGMAAHHLEPRRRKIAILVGGGAAIVLLAIGTRNLTLESYWRTQGSAQLAA